MKKIFAIFVFLILLFGSQAVFASKIPDKELEVLMKSDPKLNVRFDGLIELPDGTSYIPVFPLQTGEQYATVNVTKTIPANKTFKDKPDFLMFNTNFALFKIKDVKDKKTIIYSSDIPYEVKMGILPQDLLVPTGFYVPEDLKIIIGDLLIPIEESTDKKIAKSVAVNNVSRDGNIIPKTKVISSGAKQKNAKYFLTTNFSKSNLNVLNSDTGKVFKQITFDSIPSDMKLSNDGKYLLVTTLRYGYVYVIDVKKDKALKEIRTGEKPYSIAVSHSTNEAYIANRGENSISVIDLESMQQLDNIVTKGTPSYIALSEDGYKIFYLDSITGIVSSLLKQENKLEPYLEVPLFRSANLSKIQIANNNIYALDRAKNQLNIFYLRGKPTRDNVVNVNDITPVSSDFGKDKSEKAAVDYNYYNGEEATFEEVKPKKTWKEKTRTAFRNLLYFPEDDKDKTPEIPINLENHVKVFTDTTAKPDAPLATAKLDPTIDIGQTANDADEVAKEVKKKVTVKEHLKKYFAEFLHYKETPEPKSKLEIMEASVEKQMDFITAKNRANDFVIAADKIYFLCSDDYIILVYDANTNKHIYSIPLEQVGYYNSIKVSPDEKIGMVTNISSKTLTVFDTMTDTISKKIILGTNAHNVLMSGNK